MSQIDKAKNTQADRASSPSPAQVSSFTPGPWALRKGTSIIEGSARFDVAIVVGQVSGGELRAEYAKANARLIAAAPALLEAAKFAAKWDRMMTSKGKEGYPAQVRSALDAAITSAEGKPQKSGEPTKNLCVKPKGD